MTTLHTHSVQYESAAHQAVMDLLTWVVLGINIVCAMVLVWGIIVGVFMFLRSELRRGTDPLQKWPALRQVVGQYLLFSLELLIAADLIETMIKPTLDQLTILAGVAALRIITGFALGKELQHLGDAPVVRSS
jgi:uncharacterized membrane protein